MRGEETPSVTRRSRQPNVYTYGGEGKAVGSGPTALLSKAPVDDRPANVFKITKYTYTNDSVRIDWLNDAGSRLTRLRHGPEVYLEPISQAA
jgi:hypothetical protein